MLSCIPRPGLGCRQIGSTNMLGQISKMRWRSILAEGERSETIYYIKLLGMEGR